MKQEYKREYGVVIIGAGFAGMGAGIRLKKQGELEEISSMLRLWLVSMAWLMEVHIPLLNTDW